MTILDKIKDHKLLEVARAKKSQPLTNLQGSAYYSGRCRSITAALTDTGSVGIIAEHKRRSPSRPAIRLDSQADAVAAAYELAGAAAISILTDKHFFGGSAADLSSARTAVNCPILRKDFIVDAYQIHESKAIGADVILLIAAILSPQQIEEYISIAHSLDLEVLLEIHTTQELDDISKLPDLLGVNNRNLKDFTVDFQRSIDIYENLPSDCVLISESGISDPAVVRALRNVGYQGFLIGEAFMTAKDPGRACAQFIQKL